jgi:hypothetical protein
MKIDTSYFAGERDGGHTVVGTTVPRLDALGHVTGRTQFFEDTPTTGLLHLKMHRSERHHATSSTSDTSGRASGPGVVKVLTHADVPNNWYTILKLINVGYDDEPVLAEDSVLYRASRSSPSSRPASAPPRGRRRGQGHLRGPAGRLRRRGGARPRRAVSSRTARTTSSTRATTAGGSASATSSRASPRPTTSSSGATSRADRARADGDDRLHRRAPARRRLKIHSDTQACFFTLDNTALILEAPFGKLQVVGGTVGGGFGGKVDVIVEPIACIAAMATNRPVKYVYDRARRCRSPPRARPSGSTSRTA